MTSLRTLLATVQVVGIIILPNRSFSQAAGQSADGFENIIFLRPSTYAFQNHVGGPLLDAPVFDAEGNRLAGPNYVAVLYGGVTPDTLQLAWHLEVAPMAPVPFMDGERAGYFRDPAYVSIPTVLCGEAAWLQVRAWDARLGASYEEVVSLGLGGYGESNLFQKRGGNSCLGAATPPEPLLGLQSFSLLPVIPEPSPMWLLLLGLPLLALRRRRLRRT